MIPQRGKAVIECETIGSATDWRNWGTDLKSVPQLRRNRISIFLLPRKSFARLTAKQFLFQNGRKHERVSCLEDVVYLLVVCFTGFRANGGQHQRRRSRCERCGHTRCYSDRDESGDELRSHGHHQRSRCLQFPCFATWRLQHQGGTAGVPNDRTERRRAPGSAVRATRFQFTGWRDQSDGRGLGYGSPHRDRECDGGNGHREQADCRNAAEWTQFPAAYLAQP